MTTMRNNNSSPIPTILLVLLSTNLFLLFSNPTPTEPKSSTMMSAFNPVEFLLSRLSAILMLYISSQPFSQQHHPLSLHSLLRRIHRTWRRPALTLLCVELYYTASASLILMLRSLAASSSALFSEAAVILGCITSLLWLWPVVFAHSEIACKLALVMSVADEEGEGMEAVKRAGVMVEGRKFEGFALTVAMTVMERAVPEGVLGFVVRLLVCFVYTGFYYECKRSCKPWKRNN